MTEDKVDKTCGGPIDPANGKCRWCKAQHERDVKIEKADGSTALLYKPNCDAQWDRPVRKVIARFRQIQITEMYTECWFCHRKNVTNAAVHPQHVLPIERGGTIEGVCIDCGVGQVITKSPVIGFEEGRALLNRHARRAAQRMRVIKEPK